MDAALVPLVQAVGVLVGVIVLADLLAGWSRA